jgi:predicted O-methyltransferase YrrM
MDLVEIREGDALQTLAQDLPETLDLVLLDGAKGLYTDILEGVDQRLHPGSLVIADDTHRCPDYVQSIRANTQKYLSMPLTDDVELSMRLS